MARLTNNDIFEAKFKPKVPEGRSQFKSAASESRMAAGRSPVCAA